MSILAARFGADVRNMTIPAGTTFTLPEIEAALMANPGTKTVFLVHGESSTGTLQSLNGVGEACHQNGALLFVDAVCTLGGVPLNVDDQKIDVVYSASQKCLGAPVAPSPLSLSPCAREKLGNRSDSVQSYYFDMNLVGEYWGVDDGVGRKYHHTGMVSNVYALREALAMLAEEGLESSWRRHLASAQKLWRGLEALGLELFVPDPKEWLPTVTTVKVPHDVEWSAVTKYMMEHGWVEIEIEVEIAGGLGPTADKVWRIGVMGFNAKLANVALLLEALKEALDHVGFRAGYRKLKLKLS